MPLQSAQPPRLLHSTFSISSFSSTIQNFNGIEISISALSCLRNPFSKVLHSTSKKSASPYGTRLPRTRVSTIPQIKPHLNSFNYRYSRNSLSKFRLRYELNAWAGCWYASPCPPRLAWNKWAGSAKVAFLLCH